jgi:long-chain acyl-CoA synthetase
MLFNIDKHPINNFAAIDDTGLSITYGELVKLCIAFKTIIPKRELVFCLCENSIGSLIGYLSLYDNKDVSLLLSASINKDLLSNLINIYQPSYLWLPERININDEYNTKIIFNSFGYNLCKTGFNSCPLNDDLSLLLTTSGSTGSPKLVRHKYGNIESNAKTVAEVFNWTVEENAICELPIQYSMGLNVINSHLLSGGTVLLVSSSLTSPKFWNFIKEYKGTSFTGVPFSYEILMKLRFTQMQLPDLKTFAQGGGKLSDKVFSALAEYTKLNNKRFFATFGTTETSARMSYLPPELAISKIGSIGIQTPGSQMFLIDDDGMPIINSDIEGELCYRGPNVTLGYAICKEDLMRGDDFKGEYKTGDIAKRDKDGYYFIVGRKKRFLKLYGHRVSLDQCERMINEKFITTCACTGDDNIMDIFISDSNYITDVKKFISEKTGIIHSAFNVIFKENIPRNENGKILYNLLK